MEGEDGEQIIDNTQIASSITIYIRSNYKKFKWQEDVKLVGYYETEKPRGKIIIPKHTVVIASNSFKDCTEITKVDCTECTNLRGASFSSVPIKSICLKKCANLVKVFLTNTAITNIDVSECKMLTHLVLQNTDIETIDLLNLHNIEQVSGRGCKRLKNVNLTGCNKLNFLNLGESAIASIELKECRSLNKLWLDKTKVTSIDVSNLTELKLLKLSETAISNINLQKCTKLANLWLEKTLIKNIDLSKCTELEVAIFTDCKELESVDLKQCNNMTSLALAGQSGAIFLPFSGCVKAEVQLPSSVRTILEGSFGKDESTWCKKVIVPNETIRALVLSSGYPNGKIAIQP